jgi:hypothetical protein
MSFATQHAAFDAVASSEHENDQHQPSSSSIKSKEAGPKQFQEGTVLQSDQVDSEGINSIEGPSDSSEPSSSSSNALPTKDTSGAIVSLRRSASVSRSSIQSPNLDNPLALFETTEELDSVVRYFASNHGLIKELAIIEQAAHAERDEMEAFQDLSPEERAAAEDEREAPFLAQSRSLKGAVLVVGSLSAVCQGWAQSVLNGSGTNTKNKLLRDNLTLTCRACHSRRLWSPFSCQR